MSKSLPLPLPQAPVNKYYVIVLCWHQSHAVRFVLTLVFISVQRTMICILGKTVEPVYGAKTSRKRFIELSSKMTLLKEYWGFSDVTLHSKITCYKWYTDIRNLISIFEEPELTIDINRLPEAIENPYTCSTTSPRPESTFIRTTLIVPYVGVIGFC